MTTKQISAVQRPVLVTGPAVEPLSIEEAKKQLEIAGTDHDSHLAALIEFARQQFEADTGIAVIEQTWRQDLSEFVEFEFFHRPVTSISSVTYYDTNNAQQTLASSVYDLDQSRNAFVLKYDQTWPDTYTRWDAVSVTYKAGQYTSDVGVPALWKQAMLLLVGHHFENRDMLVNESAYNRRTYDQLVTRIVSQKAV